MLTVDDYAPFAGCAAVGNPSGGLPGNSISPETQFARFCANRTQSGKPKSQVGQWILSRGQRDVR